MSVSRVALRYAKSLFGLADEQGVLDKVRDDMYRFWETCNDNRELVLMLKSPIVPGAKKESILKAIFESDSAPLTIDMFSIIIKKKREIILQEIAEEFFKLYDEKKGIVKVEVTSAFKLDDTIRKNITAIFSKETGAEINLEESIDEDLIGGFVVTMDDLQYDASVKSKLNKLRVELA
ncbi:ATP synthase F1 subunit delta [bacterium AH-315-C07]|nr:ATP synthase F1 subunit delta [bacterium AH-315-C07]